MFLMSVFCEGEMLDFVAYEVGSADLIGFKFCKSRVQSS